LFGFLGIFRQRAPNHDEAVLGFPFLRLKPKLGHAPAELHVLEPRSLGQRQVAAGFAAHDNIAAARLVQISDQLSREKARVCQQADPDRAIVGGTLPKQR